MRRETSILGLPSGVTRCVYWMVQFTFSRGVSVSDHKFSWFDAYVYCGYATVDDTPLLNVSGWKRVGAFSK